MKAYPWTPAQADKVRGRTRISGPFAIEKRLWEGRKVAVYFMRTRGDFRHQTDMRFMYGTLVLNPNAPERVDQIGVRDERTGEVHAIHAKRVKAIYDMTRPARP